MKHVLASANLSAPEGNQVRSAKSIAQILEALQNIESRSENQQKFLDNLSAVYKRGTAPAKVIDVLSKRLPKFLYFSEYYKLPGKVAMREFARKKAGNLLTNPDRVFEALLHLAGTTPEDIDTIATFDRLKASLQAVSNRLTDEIFEYWTQNAYLDVDSASIMHVPKIRRRTMKDTFFEPALRTPGIRRRSTSMNAAVALSGFFRFSFGFHRLGRRTARTSSSCSTSQH